MAKNPRQPRWQNFGIIFLIILLLSFVLKSWLAQMGVNYLVLVAGNFILFLATVISFQIYKRSLSNNRPQFIVRMVYSGLLAKMGICLVAVVVYVVIARSSVDKFGLAACFLMYIIYTYAEVKWFTQLSKQNKHA